MKLKSGEVVVDRFNSHLHADAALYLSEALAKIESRDREFFVEEVNFGSPIGETICVGTGPADQIVFAKRPKRWGHSRFVRNRTAEVCSSLVVILMKAEGNGEYGYVLITAFVGTKPEPEPWDQKNFSRQIDPQEAERLAREFWNSHALVWGCEEIIPGTETTRCPW